MASFLNILFQFGYVGFKLPQNRLSEFEKSILVQKLAASRLRIRRSAGKCEGRKPYGFTEFEQSVIAKIQTYRSEGLSFVDIANRLNTNGIKPRTPTRAGKETKWHPNMIQRIVKQN